MKLNLVVMFSALATVLTSAPAFAKSNYLNKPLDLECESSLPAKPFYAHYHFETNGTVSGGFTAPDVEEEGELKGKDFGGDYVKEGAAIVVFAVLPTVKINPGRQLPSLENRRRPAFQVLWIKGQPKWKYEQINEFNKVVESPSGIICTEYKFPAQ